MYSTDPIDVGLVVHRGLKSLRKPRPFCLGVYQVDLCQQLVGVENIVDVRPYFTSKHRQDADHLPALLSFQLTYLVVGFHHFGRLDKHGLSRGTLIMYDTVDPALHRGSHRQHQSSVAHGGGSILIHQSVLLGCVQDCK